ncbi:hypothetical protein Hdeb2414_s0002g00054201 [Helianthus debilis subsp. tardiflorus]
MRACCLCRTRTLTVIQLIQTQDFQMTCQRKWFYYILSTLLKPVIKKICFKFFSKQTMNSLNFMLIFRMFFLRLHFQNYGTVGIGKPMGI